MTDSWNQVDWSQAECGGVGWHDFFDGSVAEAKAMCQRCPIQRDCLRYAVNAHEVGVWGGLTEQERRAMVRRLRWPQGR